MPSSLEVHTDAIIDQPVSTIPAPVECLEHALIIDVISSMYILDLTYIEADTAGRIESELLKKGTLIGTLDILIASCCITTKQEIITRNTKQFAMIKELKTAAW